MTVASPCSSRQPWLSIIVATWQSAETLERCLKSISQQSCKAFELLIADGASSDGTIDIVRRNEAQIAWWKSAEDSGIYDAWNQALANACGEYVCFLGADDAWSDADALARLRAAVGTQAYDLVTSRGRLIDSSSGRSSEFGSEWNYRHVGRRMVVCHPGLLHRRSLFARYGMFDTRYRIAGDLDFLLRLPLCTTSLHVDAISVTIEASGLSRKNVLARLREQRDVLSRCQRYGRLRAYLAWADKLVRFPVARALGIPH